MPADTKTTVDSVVVRLIKPHIHAGKAYKAGEDLQLPGTLVPWLVAQGVIAPPAARSST